MKVSPRMQTLMDKRGWTLQVRTYFCDTHRTFIYAHSQEDAETIEHHGRIDTSGCVVHLLPPDEPIVWDIYHHGDYTNAGGAE